jgi:uncharacterized LabA/DUF88 family protein
MLDGNYLLGISGDYKTEHPVNERIHLLGFKEFILQKVARVEGVSLRNCHIVESHFFIGRDPLYTIPKSKLLATLESEREIDEALRKNNITPHYLPTEKGKEKGVDVLLALTALKAIQRTRADMLVLVTGDGDFHVIPREVEVLGCKTVLMSWDYTFKRKGSDQKVERKTAYSLMRSVHHVFEMDRIIEDGLRDEDPLVFRLFGVKQSPYTETPEQKADRKKDANPPTPKVATNHQQAQDGSMSISEHDAEDTSDLKPHTPKEGVYHREFVGELMSVTESGGVVLVNSKEVPFLLEDCSETTDFTSLTTGMKLRGKKENIKGKMRVFDIELSPE